jgi:hypothetical protein
MSAAFKKAMIEYEYESLFDFCPTQTGLSMSMSHSGACRATSNADRLILTRKQWTTTYKKSAWVFFDFAFWRWF